MPSLEESKRQVRENLDKRAQDADHEDILASLQDEIDKHNAAKDELQRTMRGATSSPDSGHAPRTAFRFKEGISDPREKRHRSTQQGELHGHRRKRRKKDTHECSAEYVEASHPFPREPVGPDVPEPVDAFRDSLFDALADDEGAQYWESVYSQPIHVYRRPTVRAEKGELEQMSDEQYIEYVKTKMWERKHPEEVLEREKSKRQKKEEEEGKTRRREEYVRKQQQKAWARAERNGRSKYAADDDAYEHAAPKDWEQSSKGGYQPEYAAAWNRYLASWDKLKHDLLEERSAAGGPSDSPAKRIPWPVVRASKPVTKPNIESFIRNAPAEAPRSRLQVLKAERVRWHPDKIQQRFGGRVDEGTMKLVTGVFQIVDAVFEEERKASD